MLSVGLVDDDAIVRTWIRQCLRETEFRVAGEATTAAEALRLVETRRPDLLIVDYHLPDGLGTELVRSLRLEGVTVPALVITATPEPGLNEAVVESGGQGVILKRGDPAELLDALRSVAAGAKVVDAGHPRRPEGVAALSPRERDILRLAGEGASNREIGEQLGIGAETVKTMLSRAFAKLGARNRIEAVTTARRRGML